MKLLIVLRSLLWIGLPLGFSPSAPALSALKIGEENASTPAKATQPKWLLKPFLNLGQTNPDRLLEIAAQLFSPARLKESSTSPKLIFEWQHRMAMVGALSNFFDPASKSSALQRKKARAILETAMLQDPALLVRDSTVESVRRIFRMQVGETTGWKKPLEKAFLAKANVIQGEGIFIRETILTALREGALRPSPQILRAAKADNNLDVQALAKGWDQNPYDTVHAR